MRRHLLATVCVLLSFQHGAKSLPIYRPEIFLESGNLAAAAYWNYPGGAGAAATFDNTASALFNGSGSLVNFGDVDPGASYSAFCWAKQTTATTNLAIFSKWSASTSERSWVIQAGSSNSAKFSVLLSGNGTTVHKNYQSSVTALATAAWHQVGFTFAGGTDTLKLYVDGAEDTAPTKTTDNAVGGSLNSNSAALAQGVVIKNAGGATSAFWAGYITHCFTANVVLTAAEVSATYNAGVPANMNNHSQFSNLQTYYQNGNLTDTTATIYDRKGSANGTCTSITISTDHP